MCLFPLLLRCDTLFSRVDPAFPKRSFTDQQLKEFKIDEGQRRVDSSWHKDGPELKRRTSNPHIDVYGRMVPRQRASTPTKAQELDLLREKLDWRLCGRGTSSTSQRINNVFQDNDKCVLLQVDAGARSLSLLPVCC